MSALEAIALGIIQGLTEFLPVSSTGHLRIVPAFAGWEDPGAGFTAITQLGTLAAVLIYFRGDLVRIALAWTRSLRDPAARGLPDARMGWYLIVATIPISILGVTFQRPIEDELRSLYVIGVMLIVVGGVMLLAERVGSQRRHADHIGMRDAVAIGIAQAVALVPGVSRSGATIAAGLFAGFDRATAARFSFLLSIPAVTLSGLFQVREVFSSDERTAGWAAVAIATLFAFVVGYASIAFLLRFLVRHTTTVFVGYRMILGAGVLALVGAGAIS